LPAIIRGTLSLTLSGRRFCTTNRTRSWFRQIKHTVLELVVKVTQRNLELMSDKISSLCSDLSTSSTSQNTRNNSSIREHRLKLFPDTLDSSTSFSTTSGMYQVSRMQRNQVRHYFPTVYLPTTRIQRPRLMSKRWFLSLGAPQDWLGHDRKEGQRHRIV